MRRRLLRSCAPSSPPCAGPSCPSALGDLDTALARFGNAVAAALAQLQAPDTHATLFPLGRSDDGLPLVPTARTALQVQVFAGGGASYAPHVDNTDGDSRHGEDLGRCFTLLYYLNTDWEERDGGALRLYLPRSTVGLVAGGVAAAVPVVDIQPVADTLLIFRADKLLHEVRPTSRRRVALTVWLFAKGCAGGGHGGQTTDGHTGCCEAAAAAGCEAEAAVSRSARTHRDRSHLYPSKQYGPCIQHALKQHAFPGGAIYHTKCLGQMWVSDMHFEGQESGLPRVTR